MGKEKKRKFQLNEKQLGYLMVLPALILIAAVTLWPVAQSFYNSMFDYRLNDPTRNQTNINYQVDLESYVNNYFYLERDLGDASEQITDEQLSAAVNDALVEIDSYHEDLVSQFPDEYEQVDELIMSFEPVRDNDLRYQTLENEFAREYRALINDLQDDFENYLDSYEEGESTENLLEDAQASLRAMDRSLIEPNFIGLANYGKYLTDARMWQSLWNTTFFTVVSVFFELTIGLAVALVINRAFIGRGAVRAAVLIPWAIPTAVSAMMWSYLYDGQFGIIAHYFAQLGLISDSSVLLSTGSGAMFSIILADVWKTMPYMALLLLAGLQTISDSLYEAAEVDGAGKVQRFIYITLPMLKSAILVALLFRTLDAFRVFDLIYVLTGGGPANSTESISVYAYQVLFAQQNFGEGSVLSVIVFISIAIISITFIKLIGSELFEGRVKK
ncbi:carbohydrate ABC transporter permease [Salisediminibacterium selenitireducens]|uniref:Binding-protein-dependent transport systems inner membrane component n=1 Tax=Bacillus selenitireducens (strain ATCC 700615 / DSM 15326 / MLS10) TaxID=439292 RepID=D6XT35_BACIE|nr:sugar ABC transporter permease [Salisediminibacterium selenitireducens]ADH98971.1 binding-protein-dependent transport systems inner membrane component [[Bacillus] selenitireducens MLS10]